MKTTIILAMIYLISVSGCDAKGRLEHRPTAPEIESPVAGSFDNYETLISCNHVNYPYVVLGYDEYLYEIVIIEGAPVLSVIENSLYGITWVPGEGYQIKYTDPQEERAYAIVIDGNGNLSLEPVE